MRKKAWSCLDDFDRSAVSEVMDSVKRKVKEEGLTDRMCFVNTLFSITDNHSAPEATIMKKIAIQGTFARFLRST